jgi:hypothetical protein
MIYTVLSRGIIEVALRCGLETANSYAGHTSTPQNQIAMLVFYDQLSS